MAAPNPVIEKVQSCYDARVAGNVAYIASCVNDAPAPPCVWVNEGSGNSPVNGSYQGATGVAKFFEVAQATERWEQFAATNYIPLADPNVVLVMGRAVGTVHMYPRAEWHFTHIWALDPTTGKFRSVESQWRVAYGDSQIVYGGEGNRAVQPAVAGNDKKKDKKEKKEDRDKKEVKKDDKEKDKKDKEEKDKKKDKKEKK